MDECELFNVRRKEWKVFSVSPPKISIPGLCTNSQIHELLTLLSYFMYFMLWAMNDTRGYSGNMKNVNNNIIPKDKRHHLLTFIPVPQTLWSEFFLFPGHVSHTYMYINVQIDR